MSEQSTGDMEMSRRISAQSLEQLTIAHNLQNTAVEKYQGTERVAPSSDSATAGDTPGNAVGQLLAEVHKEMRVHSQAAASRGYISKVADFVYRKDESSFQNLLQIETSLQTGAMSGSDQDRAKIAKAIEEDQKALETQNTVSGVTSQIVKVAPLFMKGSVGWVGTITANALEQAKPSDSFSLQLVDGIMGATKGAALKGTFSLIPDAMPSYGKGALLGASSRFLEVGLDRHTYIDSQGNTNLSAGLMSTFQTALSPRALAIDVATFAVAGTAVRGVNHATRDVITRSPFLSTVTTGSVFGFSTGASTELIRQWENDEALSMGKMWQAGFSSAIISGIASIPGGLQAQAALNAERQKVIQEMRKADENRPESLKTRYEEKDTGRVTLNGRDLSFGISSELAQPPYNSTTIARDSKGNYVLTPGVDTNTSVNGKAIARPRVLRSGDVIKTYTYSAAHEDSVKSVIHWKPKADGSVPGVTDKNGYANLGEAAWEPTFAQKNPDGKIMLHVGSRTNTKVNGTAVERGQVVEIHPGDKITTQVGRVPVEASWGTEIVKLETKPKAWIFDRHGEKFDLTGRQELAGGEGGARLTNIGADNKGIFMKDMGMFKFFAPDRMRINGRPFLPTERVYVWPTDKITNNGKPLNFGVDAGKPKIIGTNTKQFWQ